ncbi:hypothetical protein Pcinc_021396, partial [Petrolisthes cinctipes]
FCHPLPSSNPCPAFLPPYPVELNPALKLPSLDLPSPIASTQSIPALHGHPRPLVMRTSEAAATVAQPDHPEAGEGFVMGGVKRQRLSSRVGGEGKGDHMFQQRRRQQVLLTLQTTRRQPPGLCKHQHATTAVTFEERTNQGREEFERCELWTPHSLAPSPPATHILRSGLTSGCSEDGQPPPCQASGVYGRGAGQRPLMSAAANDSWETRAGRGAAGTPPLYRSGQGLGLGCGQGATGHHNNTTNTLQHWRQEFEQGTREMKSATVTIVCCLMEKQDSRGMKLKPGPGRGSGRVGGGEGEGGGGNNTQSPPKFTH